MKNVFLVICIIIFLASVGFGVLKYQDIQSTTSYLGPNFQTKSMWLISNNTNISSVELVKKYYGTIEEIYFQGFGTGSQPLVQNYIKIKDLNGNISDVIVLPDSVDNKYLFQPSYHGSDGYSPVPTSLEELESKMLKGNKVYLWLTQNSDGSEYISFFMIL
ncbi:MAG: hypothetical protein ABI721_03440 [Candidatus Dojkabacteria bacterium]